MERTKDAIALLALTGLACAIASCSGCTSLAVEYEHVSHPFVGPPFGPQSEEDWLDHIQACGTHTFGLSARLNAYGTSCVGYLLTDGGFYGPSLTGSIRAGIEFSLTATPIRATHNALGGYIPACGELPGMVGDDC